MKKKLLFTASAAALLLCGCGGGAVNYDLPDQPAEFDVVTFTNPAVSTDAYASFEYNGRTYIPFGTPADKLTGSDVRGCLGYITENGNKDESSRVLLLSGDPDCNYLAVTDIDSPSLQTTVMRAIDTQKKDIRTPDCIHDEGYTFWQ